jgi:Protein of unknown function (DUF2867)
MESTVRVAPEEYQGIPLRAHSLLADVPLHDVWAVDLPGPCPGRTIVDVRSILSMGNIRDANAVVKALFRLRAWLGRAFSWDREPAPASQQRFLHRLSAADRESSLVPPGTREGHFQVLLVLPQEAIWEIWNSTVHAFSVVALVERSSGYRLYWAIYVQPVGRVTGWYMRAIDPFRRVLIYPAVLRHFRAAWARRELTG